MATKKKRGGARVGAGRKPLKDPKDSVFIWVRKSVIKKHGGKDKLKVKLEAACEGNGAIYGVSL